MAKSIGVLSDRKGKIDETYRSKTELVEANRADQKQKFVLGDLLLDHVMKVFGLRFDKDHDGSRIAALMREDEIDPSIKTLIREPGAAQAF